MARPAQTEVVEYEYRNRIPTVIAHGILPALSLLGAAIAYGGGSVEAYAGRESLAAAQQDLAANTGAGKIAALTKEYYESCEAGVKRVFDAATGTGHDVYTCPVAIESKTQDATVEGLRSTFTVNRAYNVDAAQRAVTVKYNGIQAEIDQRISKSEQMISDGNSLKDKWQWGLYGAGGALTVTLGIAALIAANRKRVPVDLGYNA